MLFRLRSLTFNIHTEFKKVFHRFLAIFEKKGYIPYVLQALMWFIHMVDIKLI